MLSNSVLVQTTHKGLNESSAVKNNLRAHFSLALHAEKY